MRILLLLAPDERDLLGVCCAVPPPVPRWSTGYPIPGRAACPAARRRHSGRGLERSTALGRSGSRDRWASAAASATGRRCELDRRGSVAAGGVPVANTPGANAARCRSGSSSRDREPEPVDGLGARPAPRRGVAAGADSGPRLSRPRSVAGGVVGFGDIGRRCAGLFAAFGCEVAYTARRPRSDARRGISRSTTCARCRTSSCSRCR